MSRRFSKIVPTSPLELERFYLDTINKLEGTTATLDDLDQRSTWPGASVTSELQRDITSLTKSITATIRAQISELERIARNMQGINQSARMDEIERAIRSIGSTSLSAKVDDLERRIDSMERSARF